MSTVRLSPKYQIVIPKMIRDALKLKSGQKIEMLYYENRIELVPLKAPGRMKGFLKGIDTRVPREEDRL